MMLTQMADATAAGEAIVVQRPRITTLIAEGTRWCSLTLVTGPPGAGKTMALALWAAAEPGGGGLGFPR